jgi:hypothetical protein
MRPLQLIVYSVKMGIVGILYSKKLLKERDYNYDRYS